MHEIKNYNDKIPLFDTIVQDNYPFIAQDFDSLTMYEKYCKIVKFLNLVIDKSNLSGEQLETITNQLNELQNYIDNLNLQSEVNNKIDEMVDDGYFETLATNIYNELIQKVESIVRETKYHNTVSSMKQDTGLESGDLVITKGFYSIRDKGSAKYQIRSKQDSDDFTVATLIELQNNLVAELIIENEEIWSKQVGIHGNGLDDDTVDLNNFIDYCAEHQLTCRLNRGIYLISNQIVMPSNSKILGEDKNYTIIKADSDMDLVYHTVCNTNASNISARLSVNTDSPRISQGYPAYTTFMTKADENIEIGNLTIDGNWQNRDLTNWQSTYTSGTQNIIREPGTGLELQWAENVHIHDVISINNPQHNINIRGASGTYSEGIDVVGAGPSRNILIERCFTDNNRYDDGITTHDSEYIHIDNCIVQTTNNINGTYSQAISNGFEIDDGSRYVTVSNCKSKWNTCGFQAKGHQNTPPAHNVVFENCIAEECHQGFVFSCTANSDTAYTVMNNRCRNIKIQNCTIKNLYTFSNDQNWNTTSLFLNCQNIIDLKVDGLYVLIGNPLGVSNISPNQRYTYARFRDYCSNIELQNINIENLKDQPKPSNITFSPITMDGNVRNVTLKNIHYDGFPHDPFFRYSSSSEYGFCNVDGIYGVKLNEDDNIYQEFKSGIRGIRQNMLFLNDTPN